MQASCTVVLGVPNVPPLSPPQLLDGSQLLVGGDRWAQPVQSGYRGAQFHVHSRTDNLSAGVPAQYPAAAVGSGAGAVFTLGSGGPSRMARTMPAACGVSAEEEERRRVVAQASPNPSPNPSPKPNPNPNQT